MAEALLELRAISASYGAIQAVSKVSLSVPKGGIVALLGSNGAGKSSTLNTISHLVDPTHGEVLFDGQAIHRLPSDEIVRRGLVQVPEGREVFKDMSVTENLELGAFLRRGRREMAEDFEKVYAMFPRLKERREQRASTLSGGEQQMLAIGRALMSRPRMIMFDEPSMGLSPLLVEQITPEAVAAHFRHRAPSQVQRYLLPKLQAMNFVLDAVLDGGVNDALNLDTHGKSLSFLLLDMPLQVPDTLQHLLAGPAEG